MCFLIWNYVGFIPAAVVLGPLSGELEEARTKAMTSPLPAVVDVKVIDDAVPERIDLQKLN